MKKKQKSVYKELAPYLGLGTQLALTVGLFALLGSWLDKEYDTKPTLLLISSVMGIVIGFYHFFKTISQLSKKEEEKKKKMSKK